MGRAYWEIGAGGKQDPLIKSSIAGKNRIGRPNIRPCGHYDKKSWAEGLTGQGVTEKRKN